MTRIGPLMIGLQGTALLPEEQDYLQHPLVGGVILFTRNVREPEQVLAFTQTIRAIKRKTPLLIAVDQEGGRVQRLQQGFLSLPAPGTVGDIYQEYPAIAKQLAYDWAWLMASECLSVGIDISFAPVLDVNRGYNTVIANRAFSSLPASVAELGIASIEGMRTAGMSAVGKHFPGHGGVQEDSHEALPIDHRSSEQIVAEDLLPFQRAIKAGLSAVMTAHICFPAIDEAMVCLSPVWLQRYLRETCHFSGAIFSDDLDMKAATLQGEVLSVAEMAIAAGCDMILACNRQKTIEILLDALKDKRSMQATERLLSLIPKEYPDWQSIHQSILWQDRVKQCLAQMPVTSFH